jgi:hypothetical protein
MNDAAFDETNDRGHLVACDCPDCMPAGSDGALDDALDSARAEMARSGIRGAYTLRPLAKTTAVAWAGDGSRTDVTRAALHTAARHAQARGYRAAVAHLDLYVA